jgi:hypothetical protein
LLILIDRLDEEQVLDFFPLESKSLRYVVADQVACCPPSLDAAF